MSKKTVHCACCNKPFDREIGDDESMCDDCLYGGLAPDPVGILASLGAKVSPALTRSGPLRITSRDCVICGPATDCICHTIEFASPEYFARLDKLHGKAPK